MRERWLPAALVIALIGAIFYALSVDLAHPINERIHQQSSQGSITEENARRNPPETFWRRAANDPTAIFTLALVAFTAVLAISTIGLWLATLRLWRSSETHARYTEESVRVASEAAIATKQSADLAALIERPYVFISTPKIVANRFSETANRLPGIQFDLHNYGRTPATIRWYETHVIIPGQPHNPWSSIWWGADVIKPGEYVSSKIFDNTYPLPAPFNELNSFWLWVEVTCFDIFDYMHTFGFSYLYTPGSRESVFNPVGGNDYTYHRVEKMSEAEWKPSARTPPPFS